MSDKLIYLASPYSHPDLTLRTIRFHSVCRVAGILMSRGEFVYSPIAHTHPIAEVMDLPTGWEYWARYDELIIRRCDLMYVLTIDGWDTSVGVQAEIEIAHLQAMPIIYVDANGKEENSNSS